MPSAYGLQLLLKCGQTHFDAPHPCALLDYPARTPPTNYPFRMALPFPNVRDFARNLYRKTCSSNCRGGEQLWENFRFYRLPILLLFVLFGQGAISRHLICTRVRVRLAAQRFQISLGCNSPPHTVFLSQHACFGKNRSDLLAHCQSVYPYGTPEYMKSFNPLLVVAESHLF